ncbi:uncharacterized protein RMCC_3126 [Mycolicibacterium canariasense]|uniref:HTTM domain-containing protein n=1 Tax=Mycolicibacterium canariasense TaxID=228230 RepID=A0A100WDI2_MYCCR|nr:hypothetical protein [Mycolicibacterium canariasense]MCV7207773.1 hypothetical protein [Mycolicibacterium canariasense]GAS96160.1 uncharacterized protein RMCC_3126 [Mycolicibacterium canariasense]
MTIAERFDRWVDSGPFTPADLGIYRIIYAISALFIVPDIAWLGRYPDFMFHAPPGPLRLFAGFPSPGVLIGLEVLRSLTLILLGLGLWTRYVSLAAAVMLFVTYGFMYCLGKVDHTILLLLAPLVLAFADWGNRYSLDAYRRGGAPVPQRQWPLRLLALLIGWGFFTAALTKLLTGWLSWSSQAARGYFVLGFLTEGRTYWLAEWLAAHDMRAMWELADWLTVIFEFAILLAMPWWRAFRTVLAVATVFHLGVLLTMSIDFSSAVVAYGAFVSWGVIARRIGDSAAGRFVATTGFARLGRSGAVAASWLCALGIGAAAWVLMVSPAGRISTGLIASNVVIVLAAAIGLSYLALQAGHAERALARLLPAVRARSKARAAARPMID